MSELERLLREVSHLLAQTRWKMTGYGNIHHYIMQADEIIAHAIGEIVATDIYKAAQADTEKKNDA